MFLRSTNRKKDGKDHRYFSIYGESASAGRQDGAANGLVSVPGTRLRRWRPPPDPHVKACYTLFVASRNVTLALPEDLLRRLKIVAAKQDTSISALLTATLFQLADQEEGYAEAQDAMLADLARGYDLGTRGKITWSRDSLHER